MTVQVHVLVQRREGELCWIHSTKTSARLRVCCSCEKLLSLCSFSLLLFPDQQLSKPSQELFLLRNRVEQHTDPSDQDNPSWVRGTQQPTACQGQRSARSRSTQMWGFFLVGRTTTPLLAGMNCLAAHPISEHQTHR